MGNSEVFSQEPRSAGIGAMSLTEQLTEERKLHLKRVDQLDKLLQTLQANPELETLLNIIHQYR